MRLFGRARPQSANCRTLAWADFPETNREFEGYQSLRTHKLDVLLRLSGVEAKIKRRLMAEWSIVAMWEPETRYRLIGTARATDAGDMVRAARALVTAL